MGPTTETSAKPESPSFTPDEIFSAAVEGLMRLCKDQERDVVLVSQQVDSKVAAMDSNLEDSAVFTLLLRGLKMLNTPAETKQLPTGN